MKPRHAAALALVGWYLMWPPFTKGQYGHYRADPTVPLAKWLFYHEYSEPDDKLDTDKEVLFDRADALEFRTYDECERLRKHFYDQWYGTKGHPGIKDQVEKKLAADGPGNIEVFFIDSLRFSRCIASDDPRLKPN